MERRQGARFPSETAIVQNPPLGTYALWRFGLAYQARNGQQPIFPLMFLVLPMVLHKPTLEIVLGTYKTSGLALFAGKLGARREDLLAVHDRALTLRHLTLEAIALGEQARLLSIDAQQATLRANALDEGVKAPPLPDRIKWLAPACERLGHWFAGLTAQQVVRMLNVEF
ncbi:DUF6521 family protein [Cupriavidus basilensis]|uniref:DUF6521 family protein n=1 Tax=Cupriavidus basilensis TaxID=68895 RepID=A0ABT6B236_9BURK|nr:three component ABC system middle component [Cupriavidus basilensis]MDF3838557.1 DUF6521 family protein [Cupriavidus basilensis]